MPSAEAELFQYGDHDAIQSAVREFLPQYEQEFTRHFYFVELKDQTASYVDRDLHEFEVRTKKGKLPVRVERVLRGRYYVILEADKSLRTNHLDFYVAGVKLRESFKLGLKPADVLNSKIRLISESDASARFELVLRDKQNRWVEAPEPPEIILNTEAIVEELEHMGNGTWQFTVTYPQGNHIIYLSVRSHGVYFKNLFRFHHVDK